MDCLRELAGPTGPVAFKCQRVLSKGQAFPVIGPILVSPIKMGASLIQMVAALAVGIIFSLLTVLTCLQSEWIAKRVIYSAAHEGMGFISFGYSLINILTLGCAGCVFETCPD